MSNIKVLPENIYNQIAAGEVIERPASVVKELVENSIDAGARNISIYIKGGGIESITIVDDSTGIESDDVETAFMPHATSKITKCDDLMEIKTLGFRGEALATVAAVSHVTMWTKTATDDLGTKIVIINGQQESKEYCAINSAGTKIEVSKLFFNVPARKKFLKRTSSETAEITNVVSRLMLSNPYVSFRYVVEGKDIFVTTGNTIREVIFTLYGKENLENSFVIDNEYKHVTVNGIIGDVNNLKPNTTYQTVIVNGRYVKDETVSIAVRNAFFGLTMKREYPFFVINIALPADLIDVNVHPNKMEVRYTNREDVYRAVYHPIRIHLEQQRSVKTAADLINISALKDLNVLNPQTEQSDIFSLSYNESYFKKDRYTYKGGIFMREKESAVLTKPSKSHPHIDKQDNYKNFLLSRTESNFYEDEIDETAAADSKNLISDLAENIAKTEDAYFQTDTTTFADCKTIGNIFNTYIIAETSNHSALLIIDQHAAHERVLYDRYMLQIASGAVPMQQSFVPYIYCATVNQIEFFEKIQTKLYTYGFDICVNAEGKLEIKGWPQAFSRADLNYFLSSLLVDEQKEIDVNSINQSYIAKKACKAAIKGGMELSLLDVDYLFTCLDRDKNLKCPHGRPIAIAIKKSAFDKIFKRIF